MNYLSYEYIWITDANKSSLLERSKGTIICDILHQHATCMLYCQVFEIICLGKIQIYDIL
jgi:hypothetical protein